MISPDDIQGLWVRDWIKAPGFEDHSTRVYWAQVGAVYADVRIPLDRPDVTGATALSDLSAADLYRLAQAEGFAGQVTLDGANCTWQRAINWHGATDTVDVGAISFDAQGRMIETGVLAEYTERWTLQRAPKMRSLRFSGDGYVGFAVSIGETVVCGLGRAERPATKPIVDNLRAGDVPTGIDALFDGVHVYGHWSGTSVVADLATNPLLEGQPVLRVFGDSLRWHHTGFDGTRRDLTLKPVTDGP